jgi:TRAP-type C4-dicarboxylate transport system permease small subunit
MEEKMSTFQIIMFFMFIGCSLYLFPKKKQSFVNSVSWALLILVIIAITIGAYDDVLQRVTENFEDVDKAQVIAVGIWQGVVEVSLIVSIVLFILSFSLSQLAHYLSQSKSFPLSSLSRNLHVRVKRIIPFLLSGMLVFAESLFLYISLRYIELFTMVNTSSKISLISVTATIVFGMLSTGIALFKFNKK